MPTTCVAFGCRNRSVKAIRENKEKLSFFRFPKKPPELRKAWIHAVRWKDWEPSDTSTLCSDHFAERDIDRTSMFSVRLHHNAVPTIFNDFPTHSQKRARTRKVADDNSPKSPIKQSTCDDEMLVDDSEGVESQQPKVDEARDGFTMEQLDVNTALTTCGQKLQNAERAPQVGKKPCVIKKINARKKLQIPKLFAYVKVAVSQTLDQSVPTENGVLYDSPLDVYTPRETELRRQLYEVKQKYASTKKKLKVTQQRVRRLTVANAKLGALNKELKEMERKDDVIEHLRKIPGINSQIMQRQIRKISEHQNDPMEYGDDLRRFAMILHGHSVSAYKFVRSSFEDCLPHSRTIGKWRESTDGKLNDCSKTIQSILCVFPE